MDNTKEETFDCEDIYKWVDSHNISRQKRNVHRDFSDAVPLVEILKQHFPKMVELHNYSPQNSYSSKLVNWQILNKKVLSRIRVPLSNETLENLAKAKPGVIEKVLCDIKCKIESRAAGDQNGENFYDTSGSEDNILRQKNGLRTIAAAEYDRIQKQILEKDETIIDLKQKVEHCENLLKLKDERIMDLSHQLQSVINDDSKFTESPRARFFTRMF